MEASGIPSFHPIDQNVVNGVTFLFAVVAAMACLYFFIEDARQDAAARAAARAAEPAPYFGSFNSRGIACEPARERLLEEARDHLDDDMKRYKVTSYFHQHELPHMVEARSNAEAIIAVRDYMNGTADFNGHDAYALDAIPVVVGRTRREGVTLQEQTVIRAVGLDDLAPGRRTAAAR